MIFDPIDFGLWLSSTDHGVADPDRADSLEKYLRASYLVGG